jgi:hypothetical protein
MLSLRKWLILSSAIQVISRSPQARLPQCPHRAREDLTSIPATFLRVIVTER